MCTHSFFGHVKVKERENKEDCIQVCFKIKLILFYYIIIIIIIGLMKCALYALMHCQPVYILTDGKFITFTSNILTIVFASHINIQTHARRCCHGEYLQRSIRTAQCLEEAG